MLTEQQRTHFETFGFFVRRNALSPDETAEITRHFEEVLAEDRAGQSFDGDKRQALLGFVEQRAELIKLVEDDRVYGVIEQLLGPDFVWIGSDGNLYVGDTGWHPDNGTPEYRRIKVAFYLDTVTKDSGCLRVIPGSHEPALADSLKANRPTDDPTDSPYGLAASEIPAFPLESNPGDIVYFNQALWHASFGGRAGRRMFTLNFGAEPRIEADYENLRRVYHSNLRIAGRDDQYTHTQKDRIYSDAFLDSDSARIRSMTKKVAEMGLI
jgi:ectoine hydroxylase-related dioxygenase (phytanoyl-CoA dioxygenase family)